MENSPRVAWFLHSEFYMFLARPPTKSRLQAALGIGVIFLIALECRGAVVVLSNQTNTGQTFRLSEMGEEDRSMTLRTGDSRPVFFNPPLTIKFGSGLSRQTYQLTPGSAYFFTFDYSSGSLQLEKIGLGQRDYQDRYPPKRGKILTEGKIVVPVKLLVDDDEPTHRRVWEPRIRERLEKASEVLEAHSGVSFKVVAIETWKSKNTQHEFNASMREFERKVKPHPAQLAIGFSSQYRIQRGRFHLGGTRGPLYPYILLKERANNVLETERLEILIHEMGHFLGASHSPEPNSVMRPLLTGGKQRRQGARVQFDPVNTLLMSLVADELRGRQIGSVRGFSSFTRDRMIEIYKILERAMPEDPSASHYQTLLGRMRLPVVLEDTRLVLSELVHEAESQKSNQSPLSGDVLTDYYVRQAAIVTLQLPEKRRAKAFLMALGIFVDDSNFLLANPLTSTLAKKLESPAEQRHRVKMVGKPTISGRQDLTKHFFVSGLLRTLMGASQTRQLGLSKEMLDAQGGTGFSFADMAANYAGTIFAERLLTGDLTLERVAQDFRVEDFMPQLDGLEEGLQVKQLRQQYGGLDFTLLQPKLDEIEQRVLNLPIYSPATSLSSPLSN